MAKQFKGIPKGSNMNFTGKGKLDEKSYVEIPSDLKTLDTDLYNPGDQVTVITTREVYYYEPDYTDATTGHFKLFESGAGWENGTGKNSVQTKGSNNNAKGESSVAEGAETDAHSYASHTEGYMTSTGTSADYSHAEGYKTTTQGKASHTEGDNTITNNPAEHAEGRYNKSNMGGTPATNTLSSTGIGKASTSIPGGERKNAFEVMQNGDTYVIGVGGYDGTNPGADGVKTLQEKVNSGGGGEPDTYLKSIEKDTENKTIKIKDKDDNETTFPYGGGSGGGEYHSGKGIFVDNDNMTISIAPTYKRKEKLRDYLYQLWYDDIDYDYAYEAFKKLQYPNNKLKSKKKSKKILPFSSHAKMYKKLGGCSQVRKGNLYGRNFDWTYDETCNAVIHVPASNGRYASLAVCHSRMTNEQMSTDTYYDEYRYLPFLTIDGFNQWGVSVGINVVEKQKNDGDFVIPSGTVEHEMCQLMLPRYILDNFKTATEAVNYIQSHIKVYIPQSLKDADYDLHYMVYDPLKSYLIELINGSYNVIDMTEGSTSVFAGKPIITNFYLTDTEPNADGTFYTPNTSDATHKPTVINKTQTHADGLERYNMIIEHYNSLNDIDDFRSLLRTIILYTNAYNDDMNPWYSEFVGSDGVTDITVDDTPETIAPVREYFKNIYNNRSRDPESPNFGSWQTTSSSIYDLSSKKLYLCVQEDMATEYEFELEGGSSGGSAEGDNESIEVNGAGKLGIKGFTTASNGQMPVKGPDGKINWVTATDEETVRTYAEQAAASATQAGTFASQSGSFAAQAVNAADQIQGLFFRGSMAQYNAAIAQGTITPNTIAFIIEGVA